MGLASSSSRSQGSPVVVAIVAAGAVAALEVASFAARDGLFLAQLPATRLPGAVVAAAVVALIATFAQSQWMRVARPQRVAPLSLAAIALGFAVIGATLERAPVVAAVALYLQVTGLGPVVISSFWAVVNERFDPHQAKRVVARMAACAALGGVVGGGLAERLTTWLGVGPLLFALAGLAAICAAAAHRLGGGEEGAPLEPSETGGLALVRRTSLLRGMALLMLLAATVETLVEYAMRVEAAKRFPTDAELVRFFAVFYTGCGLLAFAIQSVVGDRLLRRFGLVGAIGMLPGGVALLGLPAALGAKLWTTTLARAAETIASTAFFRAGFQLLYTPMARSVRRPAKAWVDVAAGSAGEVLGAAILFALLFTAPGLPTEWVATIAVAGAALSILVVRRLHHGYVGELRASLRRGQVEIRAEEALDRTTLETIASSRAAGGRTSLLEQVRAYDAAQQRSDAGGEPSAPAPSGPFSRWPAVLESRDLPAVRAALAREIDASPDATPEKRLRLVAWVLPLLAEDVAVARAARDYLRPMASRAVGQLVDALLAAERPRLLRTRVAWILGGLDDERAEEGLWRGVADESFPVRVASARALARIAARGNGGALEPSRIHAAVLRELEADPATWGTRRGPNDTALGERSVLLSRDALGSVPDALEHVFTLLALAHDRALIASALAGVGSDDPGLRGTALELLESVLPAPVRRALWPRLEQTGPDRAPGSERTRGQMESELLQSVAGKVVDLDALGRES